MNKKIYLLLILFPFLYLGNGYALPYEISLEAEGLPDGRYYLIQIRGDEYRLVDSTLSSEGKIFFRTDTSDSKGMYRIVGSQSYGMGRNRGMPFSIEFINAHEDVKLKTRYQDPVGAMLVEESDENRIYYHFLHMQEHFRSRFGRLLPLLEVYRPQDLFFMPLSTEMVRVQTEYYDSLIVVMGEKPESIASAIIAMELEPVYNPVGNTDFEQHLRESFLSMVSFDEPLLINSQVYTQKILTYLGLYRSPELTQSEQENLFIEAVDRIMERSSYNQEVYDFIMNYLIDGFEQYQMEKLLVHIADNYLEGECETENEAIAQARLEKYRKMAIGNRVNDFTLLDIFDKPERLSELGGDTLILVFWSSECPHCTRLMPRLAKWYDDLEPDERPGLYTVSIDENEADWSEYVLMNDLPGVNTYVAEGWDSNVAREYNLYATPTIFILNKNLEILEKPVSFREVEIFFEE